MSKFSKRAKFLSIFAAASAVSSAGARAGATTIPGYIPPSFEAQNAVKFEKNLGLNANRNNLQITEGPRFSIDPGSAAVGAAVTAAAGTVGFLIKDLFFNPKGDAANFAIKSLKGMSINRFEFSFDHNLPTFKCSNNDGMELGAKNVNGYFKYLKNQNAVIKNKKEKKETIARQFRLGVAGINELMLYLPMGIDGKVEVFANNDKKIHLIMGNGKDYTEESLEQAMKDLSKSEDKNEIEETKEYFKAIKGLLNSRLVKEVLGEALNKKNYYEPLKKDSGKNEIEFDEDIDDEDIK